MSTVEMKHENAEKAPQVEGQVQSVNPIQEMDTDRKQAADMPLEQLVDTELEQAADRVLAQAADGASEQTADEALEQAADTPLQQNADTSQGQVVDAALEQMSDTSHEQAADAVPEQVTDLPSYHDGEQGLGQIDVASRNAEIYQKYREGYIHAQLSREYSLSPEWIRRICEDQERKQRNSRTAARATAAGTTSTTGAPEAVYVAVIEPEQASQVFYCQHGKVIREMPDVPEEMETLIRQCVERLRRSATTDGNEQIR